MHNFIYLLLVFYSGVLILPIQGVFDTVRFSDFLNLGFPLIFSQENNFSYFWHCVAVQRHLLSSDICYQTTFVIIFKKSDMCYQIEKATFVIKYKQVTFVIKLKKRHLLSNLKRQHFLSKFVYYTCCLLYICCMARSLRSLRQVATLRHDQLARRSASLRSCI